MSRRIFFAFSGLSLVQGTCHHVDMGNQEEQGGTEEGDFSPLGLALLKQFAAGFSATCLFITYTFRLFLLVFTRKKMFLRARNMCKHSRLAKLRSRCVRLSSCHISEELFWEERDLLDPKLRKAAAMEGGNDLSKFLPLALPGDGAQTCFHQRDLYAAPPVFFQCFKVSDVADTYPKGSCQEVGRGHHAPYLEGTGLGLQAHIWRLKQGTRCSWFKKKD